MKELTQMAGTEWDEFVEQQTTTNPKYEPQACRNYGHYEKRRLIGKIIYQINE